MIAVRCYGCGGCAETNEKMIANSKIYIALIYIYVYACEATSYCRSAGNITNAVLYRAIVNFHYCHLLCLLVLTSHVIFASYCYDRLYKFFCCCLPPHTEHINIYLLDRLTNDDVL